MGTKFEGVDVLDFLGQVVELHTLSEQIKELESRMTANGELQKQIVSYGAL